MTELRQRAIEVVLVARRALSDVIDLAPGEVVVIGDGVLAHVLRRDLGVTSSLDDVPAPTAVIDTTGAEHSIALAIQRVASGGRVVLAAEPEITHVPVRTYADIHVRGITVIGVPSADALPSAPASEAEIEWVLAREVDHA